MRSSILPIAALAMILAPAAAFAQTGTAPVVAPSGTNPPGTAASRALDKAAGTNTSGANPAQSDGTPGNPPGTVASRATDRATAQTRHVAQRPQTVRNNSVTRGVDRAAGTDNSGAYPAQADGMPGNPRGTAVSRTLGTTNK